MALSIENMAQGLGISVTATWIMIGGTLLVLAIMYSNIQKKKERTNFILGSIVFAFAVIYFTGAHDFAEPVRIDPQTPPKQGEITNWQRYYESTARTEFPDYIELTENTIYYDYDSIAISNIAYDISHSSSTTKDAIRNTLKYVFENVAYLPNEADEYCYDGTAPSILASGTGQCDTQSIVVISILRKMGIMAKPVGGCVYSSDKCNLQAIFPQYNPKFTELDEIIDTGEFSRGVSRAGGLHAWVTAWVPEEGWLTLEATNGQIADTRCWNYHIELYVEEKEDLCVSKNYQYSQSCRNNNLAGLNANGLGLVNEVTP